MTVFLYFIIIFLEVRHTLPVFLWIEVSCVGVRNLQLWVQRPMLGISVVGIKLNGEDDFGEDWIVNSSYIVEYILQSRLQQTGIRCPRPSGSEEKCECGVSDLLLLFVVVLLT